MDNERLLRQREYSRRYAQRQRDFDRYADQLWIHKSWRGTERLKKVKMMLSRANNEEV